MSKVPELNADVDEATTYTQLFNLHHFTEQRLALIEKRLLNRGSRPFLDKVTLHGEVVFDEIKEK